MKKVKRTYGLTPKRHEEVDAQLADIEEQLTAIVDEIDEKAPNTNKHGHAWRMADFSIDYLRKLRAALKHEQRWRR